MAERRPLTGSTIVDRARVAAEWDAARLALVCEPGTEALFGMVHPEAGDHLRPRSLAEGVGEHRALRRQLEDLGVRVVDVREALAAGDPDRLRGATERALVYHLHPDVDGGDRATIAELHKRTIHGLDPGSLADLLLLRPTGPRAPPGERTGPGTAALGHLHRRSGSACSAGAGPARRDRGRRDRGTVAARRAVGRGSRADPRSARRGADPAGDRARPPRRRRRSPRGAVRPPGRGIALERGRDRAAARRRRLRRRRVGVVHGRPGRIAESGLDSYLALYGPALAGICEDQLESGQPEVDVYVPEPTMAGRRYRRARTVALLEYLLSKGMHVLVFSIEEREAAAAEGLLVGPMHALVPRSAGVPFRTRLREHGVTAEPVSLDALEAAAGGPRRSVQVLLQEPQTPT